MTTTEQPGFGEAVKADRKRKSMTLAKYSALTGVSVGKLQGAERGTKMKPDTIEALLPHVGDLLSDNGGYVSLDGATIPAGGVPADYQAARASLIERYEALQQRLGGKPAPPYGLPSYYRVDSCPPEDMMKWDAWITRVNEYMDGVDAENTPVVTESTVAEAEVNEELGYSGAVPWSDMVSEEQMAAGYPLAVPVWLEEFDEDDDDQPLSPLEKQLQASIEQAHAVGEPTNVTEHPAYTGPTNDGVSGFLTQAEREMAAEPQLPEGGVLLQFPGMAEEHKQAISQPQRQLDTVTIDPNIRYLTNGELQTFKDCERRWWLEYYRALGSVVEKRTGAAALGTRVHKALAVLYPPDGESPGDALAELDWTVADDRQYLEQNGADETALKELGKEHDMARAIVEGYLEWVTETAADAELKVISAEQPLVANPAFPDFEHVRLLTLEDVRVQSTVDGSRAFLDHKTLQAFYDLESWAHMNPQMKHYGLAEFLKLLEEATGNVPPEEAAMAIEAVRTDGAILNMLRKVKRTATAKPPFFKRHPIRWNTDTLRSYWRDTLGTLRKIEAAKMALDAGGDHHEVVPPRPSKDCSWKCPFFLECPMFDDGSHVEAMLSETKTTVNPWQRYEPELRDVVAG